MERKSCSSGRSYVSTPKEEPMAAGPKKGEDVKPVTETVKKEAVVEDAKGSMSCGTGGVKSPKTEVKEEETVKVNTVVCGAGWGPFK